MYKSQNRIIADAGEIPDGVSFVPEDYDLPADEVNRLFKIGAIVQLEPDPVDAEEGVIETGSSEKPSRKSTK